MSGTDLRSQFDEYGFARLPRGFTAERASTMAAAVWDEMERRYGILRRDPSTWTVTEPRGLGALRRSGAFDALATPTVRAAITTLVGRAGWPAPFSWGDPLVTMPGPGDWNVPVGGWHIDFPARGASGSALLLKWLGYLAPVAARGGGTVVLAGSHRLVARYLEGTDPSAPAPSATVREAIFDTHPWLRGIRRQGNPAERIASLMDSGVGISGVGVRVVELTGQPGDVVFMHPLLFHAPAPNCSRAPRLMVTGGLAGLG